MTSPDNNDAALVRQARAFCDALVEEGTLGRAAIVNSLVIRLAATAERADELAAQADRAGHEAAKLYERTEAAEAALLAAQQERDALMAVVQSERPPEHVVKFFQRLHGLPEVGHLDWQARAERAEATSTQLRLWAATDVARARGLAEALARPLIAAPRPGSREEIATEIVALLADPLAQDAEQANA